MDVLRLDAYEARDLVKWAATLLSVVEQGQRAAGVKS